MGLVSRIQEILMPEDEDYLDEIEEQEEKSRRTPKNEENIQKFANASPAMERPVLTVHENQSLRIEVFVPECFDQVNRIADCLKRNEAVIVNYEQVDSREQVRICDFLNGACYIMNGEARRISEKSVLYVPNNVEISKELYSYDMPSYSKVKEG